MGGGVERLTRARAGARGGGRGSRLRPRLRTWPVLRAGCTKPPVWARQAVALASDAHVRLAAHVPVARMAGRALRSALFPRPSPFARLSHASDAPNGPVQARGTVGRSDVCISGNSVRPAAAYRADANRRRPAAPRPSGGGLQLGSAGGGLPRGRQPAAAYRSEAGRRRPNAADPPLRKPRLLMSSTRSAPTRVAGSASPRDPFGATLLSGC